MRSIKCYIELSKDIEKSVTVIKYLYVFVLSNKRLKMNKTIIMGLITGAIAIAMIISTVVTPDVSASKSYCAE